MMTHPAESAAALLAPFLLADSRLPTGGYAHSASLEPAVVAGLSAEQVPEYLATRMRTVALVEAAAVVLACRYVHDGARSDTALGAVQEALLARTPSAPLRTASASLARGYTRLATRTFPDHPATLALASLGREALRPTAFGVFAGLLGAGARDAARLSLYGDAQTAAAAAMKLLPLDPVDTVQWMLHLAPDIDRAVQVADAVLTPGDIPAMAAPFVEYYAFAHHHRTRRIFVA